MFIHRFMNFKLINKDSHSNARAGEFETDHGIVQTPIFMPVGTVGTVKGVHQRELEQDINPNKIARKNFIGEVLIHNLEQIDLNIHTQI